MMMIVITIIIGNTEYLQLSTEGQLIAPIQKCSSNCLSRLSSSLRNFCR